MGYGSSPPLSYLQIPPVPTCTSIMFLYPCDALNNTTHRPPQQELTFLSSEAGCRHYYAASVTFLAGLGIMLLDAELRSILCAISHVCRPFPQGVMRPIYCIVQAGGRERER
eukprot:scpid109206/ scgid21775/ 